MARNKAPPPGGTAPTPSKKALNILDLKYAPLSLIEKWTPFVHGSWTITLTRGGVGGGAVWQTAGIKSPHHHYAPPPTPNSHGDTGSKHFDFLFLFVSMPFVSSGYRSPDNFRDWLLRFSIISSTSLWIVCVTINEVSCLKPLLPLLRFRLFFFLKSHPCRNGSRVQWLEYGATNRQAGFESNSWSCLSSVSLKRKRPSTIIGLTTA